MVSRKAGCEIVNIESKWSVSAGFGAGSAHLCNLFDADRTASSPPLRTAPDRCIALSCAVHPLRFNHMHKKTAKMEIGLTNGQKKNTRNPSDNTQKAGQQCPSYGTVRQQLQPQRGVDESLSGARTGPAWTGRPALSGGWGPYSTWQSARNSCP